MTKYRVDIITKQRNTFICDATDEETAIQGSMDLLEENYQNAFDTFILGPDVTVKELTS